MIAWFQWSILLCLQFSLSKIAGHGGKFYRLLPDKENTAHVD